MGANPGAIAHVRPLLPSIESAVTTLPPEPKRPPRKRSQKARPIIEFPTACTQDWIDPPGFAEAIALHVRRHGDTYRSLHRAIILEGETFDRKTIHSWAVGAKMPRSAISMRMLERIEHRYRLPGGYFAAKLPSSGRAIVHELPGIPPAERRRLAWHLPDDFDLRSPSEKDEILAWVRTVIITGSTEYRRYQSEAVRTRYGLRFPDLAFVDALKAIEDSGPPGDLAAPLLLAREAQDEQRVDQPELPEPLRGLVREGRLKVLVEIGCGGSPLIVQHRPVLDRERALVVPHLLIGR